MIKIKNILSNKKLIILVSIALILIALIISTIIYQNSFGTKVRHNDVFINHTVDDNNIYVTIIPKTTIKNFRYTLSLNSDLNELILNAEEIKKEYLVDRAEAHVAIKHTFKRKDSLQTLEGADIDKAEISIKNGKIKNKNANENYNTSVKDCKFDFYISTQNEQNVIYCNVVNRTKKTLNSINDLKAELNFGDNKTLTVYIDKILFDDPLDPKESTEIIIKKATGTANFDLNTLIEQNENKLKAKSYETNKYILEFKSSNVQKINPEIVENILKITLIIIGIGLFISALIVTVWCVKHIRIRQLEDKKRERIKENQELKSELKKQQEATEEAQKEAEAEKAQKEELKREVENLYDLAESAQKEAEAEKAKKEELKQEVEDLYDLAESVQKEAEIEKFEKEELIKKSDKLKEELASWQIKAQEAQKKIQEENKKRENLGKRDYRLKYEKPYRCNDGDYVRSKAERDIDNFLSAHRIWHEYEPEYVCHNGKKYYPDFLITDYGVYIEYFGSREEDYLQKKEEKKASYAAEPNMKVEYLEPEDDANIAERLEEICRKYNIPLN